MISCKSKPLQPHRQAPKVSDARQANTDSPSPPEGVLNDSYPFLFASDTHLASDNNSSVYTQRCLSIQFNYIPSMTVLSKKSFVANSSRHH